MKEFSLSLPPSMSALLVLRVAVLRISNIALDVYSSTAKTKAERRISLKQPEDFMRNQHIRAT